MVKKFALTGCLLVAICLGIISLSYAGSAVGNEGSPFYLNHSFDPDSDAVPSPAGSPEFFNLFSKFGGSLDDGTSAALAVQEVCGTFFSLSAEEVKEFEEGRGAAYARVKKYVPTAFDVRGLCTSLASLNGTGGGFDAYSVLENAGYAGFAALLNTGVGKANKSGIPYLTRLEFEGGIIRGASQFSATTVQPLYTDDINHHYVFNQLSWYRQSGETDDGDADDTLNAGLAYRRLVNNETLMLGGNVFLDHQTDQNHNRMSVGLDAQTALYGVAINHYVPLTKWRTVDDLYEARALGGWDVEFSGKHPDYPNWTGYLKGYTWKRYDRVSDIYGVAANVEWNPIPVVVMGLGFTSENELNNDVHGFLRMRFRFDEPLAAQWKPRTGLVSIKDRVYEKVRRENIIRTQKRARQVQQGNSVIETVGANTAILDTGTVALYGGMTFDTPATVTVANTAGVYARLRLVDGGILTLGQDTEVTIEPTQVTLVRGMMHYVSGSGNVTINIPGGTITLLGTDLDVVTDGSNSSVRVREGAVQLAGSVSNMVQIVADAMGRFAAGIAQTVAYKSAEYLAHAETISEGIDRVSSPIKGGKVAPYNTDIVVLTKDATSSGDTIQLSVPFSDVVLVTGVPVLTLDIAGQTRSAAYVSGSGSHQLVFEYPLPASEAGVSTLQVTGIDLASGGAIRDSAGKNAVTVFAQDAITRQPIIPTGHSVTFTTDPVNSTNLSAVTFSIANGSSGETYVYTITDAANNTVTGNGTISGPVENVTGIDVSSLVDGTLTISVIVTDIYGNQAAAVTDTVEKITTLPTGYTAEFTTDPVGPGNVTAVAFEIANATTGDAYSFTITDGDNNQVTGSGTVSSDPQPVTGIDVTSLVDGSLALQVVITDANGNPGAAATDKVVKFMGYAPTAFVATWNTANTSAGSSAANQIHLPLESDGTYNFTVNWGDGTTSTITSWNQAEVTHTYATAGTYTVALTGTIRGWKFNNNGDRLKILDISQWGNINFGNDGTYFHGAENLTASATDAPDLTGTTNMRFMFGSATQFNGAIGNWDVSNVTNMQAMFYRASSFNQPLDGWDVHNVTNMNAMFQSAAAFNQPLSNWDVSQVTVMNAMFTSASTFNQPLNSWNVGNVANMNNLFQNATAFNQPLDNWNVGNVTSMNTMFSGTTAFTPVNYAATLNGWTDPAKGPLQNNVVLDASGKYTPAANPGRASLISTYNWTINDGGPVVPPPTAFVATWNTANTSAGSSAANQIRLPLESDGAYNFTVNWGDGTNSTITSWNQAEVTHTYATAGTYTVALTGTIRGWRFGNAGDRLKILDVSQWGSLNFGNNGYYFNGAANLTASATDAPDLTGTRNMWSMFDGASSFNGAIGNWDVSNVTTMHYMFQNATVFNQPLGGWNVGNVTGMAGMFTNARDFNQPIDAWNVGNVQNMSYMFSNARSFNQSLNSWNVTRVPSTNFMFADAIAFNGDIGNWDVGNITNMTAMFYNATSFNRSLNNWNMQNVTVLNNMFDGAISFNGAIGNWDIRNVTSMGSMFRRAMAFNQNIENWNTANVTDMNSLFQEAANFNQPLNSWDVGKVSNMTNMFLSATAFDQPLDNWNVNQVLNMTNIFYNTPALSMAHYALTLNGWADPAKAPLKNDVRLDAPGKYLAAADPGRASLVGTYGWVINDGGP